MLTPSTDGMFTATVVISGISIVLGVLLLLILVFYLFGQIVSKTQQRAADKSKERERSKADEKQMLAAAQSAMMKQSEPEPAVEDGISPQVVAAIAAAVAASDGPGAVIRSVKRVDVGTRNPWAADAVRQNTKPF